jgi:hypothetical protein
MMNMSNITNIQKTMSTREIADLVEARHNDVTATVERLFGKGLLRSSRETRREFTGGRPVDVYDLIERDTHLVVSGYSDEHRAKVIDRWQALEETAAQALPPRATLTPVSFKAEADALKAIMGDDELKRLAPLLWQEITDAAQNAMRNVMGSTLALPTPDAPKLLDVVEIAKAHGIELPQNLRGAAGKYVKARVTAVETERLINGAIRKSSAYADHAAVAAALHDYIAGRKA